MDATDYPLEISVTETKRLLDEEACTALLIDVREPYETEICHVKGAELIPMRQIPEKMHDLPKDEHLLIMCHTGVRSMRVTEFLRAQGFSSVSNVGGGIAAWTDQIDPTLQRY
jgi:adenylyltransferase/sulfurtransferase